MKFRIYQSDTHFIDVEAVEVQKLVGPEDSIKELLGDMPYVSQRCADVLRQAGAKNVGDVCTISASQLLRQRNCGRVVLEYIQHRLAKNGLHLAGEPKGISP